MRPMSINTCMAENDFIFVDTNYFVALFNPSDSLHEDAREISKILAKENKQAIISNFIFAETVTVLAQRRGKDIAFRAGEYLLSHSSRMIHIDEELQIKSWDIFREVEAKDMSFVDCSILAVMKREGIDTLLTFDKKDFQPLRKQFHFSFYDESNN